ncbi:hypothetical protein [Pseudomonas reactans]|uniref:hypothetical protein n=1 Tax=Pseudomonas reactans TaxID=117680 RepID=UPI0015A4D274|nr:hypothetical protein [Pseudomonas reactans]NWC89950.1 hypothetical protein [Pseudomonas reactans]
MGLNINEVLPALVQISEQQLAISDRLLKLIETFKKEPEPVEPTLRSLLMPLSDGIDVMQDTLTKTKD